MMEQEDVIFISAVKTSYILLRGTFLGAREMTREKKRESEN